MAQILNNIKAQKSLVVIADNDKNIVMSARNIQGMKTTLANNINVYEILKYKNLVVTKAAIEKIQEVFA